MSFMACEIDLPLADFFSFYLQVDSKKISHRPGEQEMYSNFVKSEQPPFVSSDERVLKI